MKKRGTFLLILSIFFASITFSITTKAEEKDEIVTEQHLASDVGAEILHAGGNAVDAAVAIGYALSVVEPCCGNIGGGGFMTLHLSDGRNIFLNFRERAPMAATRTLFLDPNGKSIPGKSNRGYLAIGVPGTVLGLETALKKYGTMNRKKIMAPAIKLAKEGFLLSKADVDVFQTYSAFFKDEPNVASIFLKNGKSYQVGDRFIQTNLADTLKLIAKNGPDVFYKGIIAKKIVDASQQNGGILTLNDFAKYTVSESSPVQCTYRGYTILSAAPPSSGGVTLCEMLNILEGYPLQKFGFNSPKSIHYIVEAMHQGFYDRNNELGDPDFVKNPTEKLISKNYAAEIRKSILPDKAHRSESIELSKPESMHTTHYSVLDQFGNAVSVTYTLNSYFGAKVIADHTGFFLNDEMDDFTTDLNGVNQFGLKQGEKNQIEPGKRPLSSMAPTIIMKNSDVVMVIGSPGGPRIITATLLAILNVLDYHMSMQEAVTEKRFHYQWLPDVIYLEPNAFSPELIHSLSNMGYQFKSEEPWGAVEAIYRDVKTKKITGVNDPRHPGGKAI